MNIPRLSFFFIKRYLVRLRQWRNALHWPELDIEHLKTYMSLPSVSFSWPKLDIEHLKSYMSLPSLPSFSFSWPQVDFKSYADRSTIMFKRCISNINQRAGALLQKRYLAKLSVFLTCVFCALSLFIISTYEDSKPAIALEYKSEPILETLEIIEPAAGQEKEEQTGNQQTTGPEEEILKLEAVLVPRRSAVISSSHDGRISEITVENGDHFRKGQVLLRYDCSELEAQAEIAKTDQDLSIKKAEGAYKLFKLDLISDLDRRTIEHENAKAALRKKIYESQLEHCTIKAAYKGHVTKRLANPGEYTRTDRVLLEIVSDEPLQAEFLLPSYWLRWVNVGAPLTLEINETGASYKARLVRIYGEVDPISQSIQVVAQLRPYKDKLLPGMSGEVTIDIEELRRAGIQGFLETQR